mgnify:FL=1
MQAATAQQQDGDLQQRWQALQQAHPGLRIRQAAAELGVSEMALVLLRRGTGLMPLKPAFDTLLEAMHQVGPVMILTRNDQVVHEVTAAFGEFKTSRSGAMGLAVGEIDIRVFFNQWCHGFRVLEDGRSGPRESLQFFDRYGTAVHKIYRVEATDGAAWEQLLHRFADPDAWPVPPSEARPVPERADPAAVPLAPFRADWASLKDVHHFHALLKKHGVDRLTALERVGPEWARRLENDGELPVLDRLLEQLRAAACPAMYFVGNPGMVQIYTGRVSHLRRTGPWMNVLDPGFSLHANTDGIEAWWVVRRPSVDGLITSVEAFNGQGELVLTVFGERKPGIPESELWREQVARLGGRA